MVAIVDDGGSCSGNAGAPVVAGLYVLGENGEPLLDEAGNPIKAE